MAKAICIGFVLGIVIGLVGAGHWAALLLLLLLAFFMDWSGDGDGRQRWID